MKQIFTESISIYEVKKSHVNAFTAFHIANKLYL